MLHDFCGIVLATNANFSSEANAIIHIDRREPRVYEQPLNIYYQGVKIMGVSQPSTTNTRPRGGPLGT